MLNILSLGHPLLLMGDFNCILQAEHRRGGKAFKADRDIRELRTFIRLSGLIDLDFQDRNISSAIIGFGWLESGRGWTEPLPPILGLISTLNPKCSTLLDLPRTIVHYYY